MNKSVAFSPLAALLLIALVGCGPTPPPGGSEGPPTDPRPTPTSTGTPVPLPTPTETVPPEVLEPLDTVTSILLQTDGVSFCDETACGVDGFYYDGSPDVAIALLTAVFDSVPTSEAYDNGDGSTSYAYSWGDGFVLYFATGPAGGLPIGLEVGVASVAGVAIETEGGVAIGTAWAQAAEAADRVDSFAGEGGDILEAWFDTVELENGFLLAVIAFSTNGSTVTSISAPITTGTYS